MHLIKNFRPNGTTIYDLTPGQEYDFNLFTESDYGRESAKVTVTRSCYTDDVINYSTVSESDQIVFQVQIASGVGKDVAVSLGSDDYPRIYRLSTTPFM